MAGKTRISEPIECKVCNKICNDSASRTRHLRIEHGIITDEQKIDYLLKFDKDNNYYCETGDGSLKEFRRAILSEIPIEEKCGRLSPDKYKFVKDLDKFDKFRQMADYLFLELGLTKENITKEIICEHKSKFSSTSIEYFLKKTNGDITKSNKLLKERQSTTSKKAFISKYGNIEGTKKFNEHFKIIHSKVRGKSYNTLESFITKYGEEEGKIKFKTARKLGAPTLENFIRLYGEIEGTEKWDKWKKSTARTLKNFQKTYGEKEGEQKYRTYRSTFNGYLGKASKESLLIFKPIMAYLTEIGMEDEIYLGIEGKKEYFLYDKKLNNFYLYDFTIRASKIIIEYNGLAFHPYKTKLTESEWNEWIEPYSKMSADEKFTKDQTKINFAKKQGFKVLEIWSDVSFEENIEIVKNFLKTHLLV